MSRATLVKYRSKVIEDSIAIEGYANAIISVHYLGLLSDDFFWDVLQDEMFNNGLRINVIERVFRSRGYDSRFKDIIEKTRRIFKIRNFFAHCNTTRSQRPDPDTTGAIPDPKRPDRLLDFDALYKEFVEKHETVAKTLIDIMDEMGIEFIQNTDSGIVTVFCTGGNKQKVDKTTG